MARLALRAPRPLLLSAAAVTAAGFLLYLPSAANGFVFDDIDIAQRNPAASDPADLRAIFGSHYWGSVTEGGNLYRPLTIWTFAMNRALTGEGAAGYHVTNALLHGLVSALVVLLGSALGLGGGGALAAGLIFAVHAVHVEAVAPVVGRSELLAALFVLSAWLCHLRAAGLAPLGRSAQPGSAAGMTPPAFSSPSRRARHALRFVAAALFAAGLLSKEHAAVLPALVVAGDLTRRGRAGWRASLATLAWMAPVGLAILALRAAILPGLAPDDPLGSVFGGIDPVTRILTATGVLGRYLWLMLFPLRLSADYSYQQIPLITSPLHPLFLASAALHLAMLAAAIRWMARGALAGTGILFYLLALFPVSNIPLSIGTVMGERLLYLPSAGLCLAAAALFGGEPAARRSPWLRRAVLAALAVACALHAVRAVTRTRDWKDQLSIFTATVRTSPRSAKAWYNLGATHDALGNPREAMAAYERALEIKPAMAQARRNLGIDLLAAGRPGEALPHLREAAGLDPAMEDVFGDIGIALARLGRLEEARRAFSEGIARQPSSPRAHYNLGAFLLESGRPAEAVEPLRMATSLAPGYSDAVLGLGRALARSGRHEEALVELEGLRGTHPEAAGALLDLARLAEQAGESDLAARARNLAGVPNLAGHGR